MPVSLITEYLLKGQLESALEAMDKYRISISASDFRRIANLLEEKVNRYYHNGDIRAARRMERRLKALKIFRDHGLDPDKLIAITDLQDGYEGKILLLSISAGRSRGVVCLRSGDDWHHEIFKNTEEEIRDLGFKNPVVVPAGGAAIRSDRNDNIVIFGSSDAYGTCDKKIAADLIAKSFPGKTVWVHH